MRSSASSTIDTTILPEYARQELHDFYRFLVDKYAAGRTAHAVPAHATAAELATSSIVGIWKDRELGDSSVFARSLREKAQKRTLS